MSTIFRTPQNPIRANAALLITDPDEDSSPWSWVQSPTGEAPGVFWQEAPTPAARRELAVAWAREPQRLQRDWHILTPRRADAEALTAALSAALAPDDQAGHPWHPRDRVMPIPNDYAIDLVNGQQGPIQAVTETTVTAQFRPYETVVTVDAVYAASHWALAWALTIHKAQGSQWDAADLSDAPSDADQASETQAASPHGDAGAWRKISCTPRLPGLRRT